MTTDQPTPNYVEALRGRELADALRRNLIGDLAGTIAQALAEAREGATLPGLRETLTTTVGVAAPLWRGESPGADVARAAARRRVRQQWAIALAERGRRPLGWPPVTVHGYRWPDAPVRTDAGLRGDGPPWPEVPIDLADVVHVTITGPTVPAA